MRKILLAAVLLVGCGAGAREAALERRMTDLETIKPAPPPPDPRIAELSARVDALSVEVAALRARPVPAPTPARGGLDKDRAYGVSIDDSPVIAGDKQSAVTMVLAVQFPEPYTHKAWPVIRDAIARYGTSLRVVVKAFVVHPQAHGSTIAACAVAYQGLLDVYDDAMWTAANPAGAGRRWPDASEARAIAQRLGANMKKFDAEVSTRCADAVTRDEAMFKALGQSAVPVFWIEGRPLEGAQPLASFITLIDAELAKAAEDRKRGGAPATYYQRVTGTKP